MIIHIRVPRFWIVVEERRRPDLHDRPVIIGNSLLQKTGSSGRVLMTNHIAEAQGVHSGLTLNHARQLSPDGIFLSPELPLYDGVWEEVIAVFLTYTPLVESLPHGEVVGDVSGCERLFGNPIILAREIVGQIEKSTGLVAYAGVASNRLVAQRAAATISDDDSRTAQIAFIAPGQEASFLAPLPISSLPDVDSEMLLSFQVLGLKTIGHLAMISEAALSSRLGQIGRRLARYARGQDDRRVQPLPESPSVKVSRSCDGELGDINPRKALADMVEFLAADLEAELKMKHLAGRMLSLMLKTPRERLSSRASGPNTSSSSSKPPFRIRTGSQISSSSSDKQVDDTGFFPNQDSRIHSMLPRPPQPGSVLRTKAGVSKEQEHSPSRLMTESVSSSMVMSGMKRMMTSRPVSDKRTLCELTFRLLERLLGSIDPRELFIQPGRELQLEMTQFAPPEQMLFPGLDARPSDARLKILERQENVLTARFGASPFRHLTSVDVENVLQERQFQWAEGMGNEVYQRKRSISKLEQMY